MPFGTITVFRVNVAPINGKKWKHLEVLFCSVIYLFVCTKVCGSEKSVFVFSARHVETVMWVKLSYHFIKKPNLRPVKCPLAQLKLLCKLASVNAMSHCCMPSLPWICSSRHWGKIDLFVHSIIPFTVEKKILHRPTKNTW